MDNELLMCTLCFRTGEVVTTLVSICVKGVIREEEICDSCLGFYFVSGDNELYCGCDDVFNPHKTACWAYWYPDDWVTSWR